MPRAGYSIAGPTDSTRATPPRSPAPSRPPGSSTTSTTEGSWACACSLAHWSSASRAGSRWAGTRCRATRLRAAPLPRSSPGSGAPAATSASRTDAGKLLGRLRRLRLRAFLESLAHRSGCVGDDSGDSAVEARVALPGMVDRPAGDRVAAAAEARHRILGGQHRLGMHGGHAEEGRGSALAQRETRILLEEKRARQRGGERAGAGEAERVEGAEEHPVLRSGGEHHADRLRGQATVVRPLALELDVDQEPGRHLREHLREQRDALPREPRSLARARAEAAPGLPGRTLQEPGMAGDAPERHVVEHHHLPRGAPLRIQLDSIRALAGGELERGERVLGRLERGTAVPPDGRSALAQAAGG